MSLVQNVLPLILKYSVVNNYSSAFMLSNLPKLTLGMVKIRLQGCCNKLTMNARNSFTEL